MQAKYDELLTILGKVDDIGRAAGLLGWDQQTYMPPGGVASRASQMATLESMAHELFTAGRVGELLDEVAPWAEAQGYDSLPASAIRVTRREYERYRKLPNKLVAAKAEAVGLAFDAWQKAKHASDFSIFQPRLERLVELSVEEAEALGYQEERYDALVDRFEPGMRTKRLVEIFDRLEKELVPLVRAAGRSAGDDALRGLSFPAQAQQDFARELLTAMGFSFERGRMDVAEHPFTSGFSPSDVRITNHPYEHAMLSNVFSTIHEGGHALYEQGVPTAFDRMPVSGSASLGMHESQSRLWENIIGRSLPFWRHFYPKLQAHFPAQLGTVPLEAFYKTVNRVKPSLIRVEADELTYNLHIILRFNLERELLNGTVRVADLPAIWNERMRAGLGVTPAHDAEGVLQDVHWSHGIFGYFPTYSLGNIYSGQIYNRMREDLPDLEGAVGRGELLGVKAWLNEHVHVHGGKYEPEDLIKKITGEGLTVEPYLEYLKGKYGK